jgi:SAM-dependent methyltransferase
LSAPKVFDAPYSMRLGDVKLRFVEQLLDAQPGVAIRTVLDAGCGVGIFAGAVAERGYQVSAFDGRAENVAEARARHPRVEFHDGDVEDKSIRDLGQFDATLCLGLLYHLENPFAAIRNLHAMTRSMLVVESLIAPFEARLAYLLHETSGEDQALRSAAFVPSESCLITMLYHVGFPFLYRPAAPLLHDEFRSTFDTRRRRTMLVASTAPLAGRLLAPVAPPDFRREDLWSRRSVARARTAGTIAAALLDRGRQLAGRLVG